jgi:ppGpp synthetase/RelA/SpoT-type nucleotidyltranferase
MDETQSPEISRLLADFADKQTAFTLFAQDLNALFGRLCGATKISAEISSRVKESQSLQRKVVAKGYRALDEVPDLAGVRVITQHLSDVDAVCEMLHREFQVTEDVPHGVDHPEAFGYASRHLVCRMAAERAAITEWAPYSELWFEVQVRTILQHAWASISHALDYKAGSDAPPSVRRKLFQVAALIEVGDALFEGFRTELDAVRRDYKSVSASEEWRELPIDVDALIASWPRWSAADIVDTLRAKGISVDEDAVFRSMEVPDPMFISEVAELGRAMRLTTVGEVVDLLSDAELKQTFLENFKPSGMYSSDYITLLAIYWAASGRSVPIPQGVERTRHDRAFSEATAEPTAAKTSADSAKKTRTGAAKKTSTGAAKKTRTGTARKTGTGE